MARRNSGFFDDDVEAAASVRNNPEQSANLEAPSRSRRRPKAIVSFPSFDDELKEGTTLSNKVSKPTLESVSKRPQTSQPKDRQRVLQDGPRRIGSQFLDLDRGFTVNIAGMDEEIVALSAQDLRKLGEKVKESVHTDLQGGVPDRIYVERNGKFYALSKRSEQKFEQATESPISSSLNSVQFYRAGRKLFLFAHGTLAGFALLHCIWSWSTTPSTSLDGMTFNPTSSSIFSVLSTIYNFLIAVCCLSCLCRMDLAEGIIQWPLLVPSAVATLLYFAAACLTHYLNLMTMSVAKGSHELGGTMPLDVHARMEKFGRKQNTLCMCRVAGGILYLEWGPNEKPAESTVSV